MASSPLNQDDVAQNHMYSSDAGSFCSDDFLHSILIESLFEVKLFYSIKE